jgi:uncharacterized protein (TIGR00369 family)
MQPDGSPARSRTFTWDDPMRTAAAVREMSGLEALLAIKNGVLPPPPVAMMLGMDIDLVESGRVVFAMEPAEYQYNPLGMVHGGVLSTLFDTAMGCAVHSRLPAGVGYTTLEIKVSFVRPVTVATGRIRCDGTVIALGSRVATAEARLLDANDRLLGHATTTCLIFRSGE